MPAHNRRPLLWFHAPVDIRDLSTVAAWRRGVSGQVTVPTFDTEADEGIYEHAIALANGNGSTASAADFDNRRDLTSGFQAQHPDGFGSGGVRITAGDRVQVWSPTDFALGASADNAVFGLPTAGAGAVLDLGSGEYRVTGDADWVRGVVEDAHLTITPDGEAPFSLPQYAYHAQNVPTLIRRRGRTLEINDDLDDYEAGLYDGDDQPFDSLEARDNAAYDNAERRIRHYIDETGHYCMAWPTSLSLAAPTWQSVTLRDRLGYTGPLAADSDLPEDTVEVVGSITVYRAARVMPGVLHTTRPWIRRPARLGGERTESERLIDGGAVSHGVSVWQDLSFEFYIDGPESPHTPDDLSAHWSRQVLRYAPLGAPITVFVGMDTRRHIETDEVCAEVPAYSDLYAADPCGGRWRGWVRSPDDDAQVTTDFDEDQQGGQYWAQARLRISPPRREE